jgi:hypothetical protein
MSRALVYSSGLHVLAALLIGFLLATPFLTGRERGETVQVAAENAAPPTLLALERGRRRAPAARQVVRPGPLAPAPPAASPLAPAVATRKVAHRSDLVATVAAAALPKPGVAAAAVVEAPPAAARVAPAAAAAPVVAAVAEHEAAAASPSPVALATQASEVPAGGWGQNFESPILADESALSDLRAKYHGLAKVQVDESGRALRVEVKGSLSPEARDEIEKFLLSLHYVPAECNGLRCSGSLVVTL